MSVDATCPESTAYLLTLLSECNLRGGFTLDEAVKLSKVRADVNARSVRTLHPSEIALVRSMVCVSQSMGKLSLEEAWTAYNALHILQQNETREAVGAGAGSAEE